MIEILPVHHYKHPKSRSLRVFSNEFPVAV
jgi:hypothetical protein